MNFSRPVAVVTALLLMQLVACGGDTQLWHSTILDAEFTSQKAEEIITLPQYLELEDEVFAQLQSEIYDQVAVSTDLRLKRYSSGSRADPNRYTPDWNRSFELANEHPKGGVLLLHGMTDSPYSLRALGQALHQQGFHVLGLRMPGHGTAPSGMTTVHWRDMAAATAIGMAHLNRMFADKPVHIVGYSTGAALAIDYSLSAEPEDQPASLILLSPAIGLRPAAKYAGLAVMLSRLPGLSGLAWTGIELEFDPYKYNSFSTNAAEQVYLLTSSVAERIEQHHADGEVNFLPPTLVIKSTVDSTVSTDAVVDLLLGKLSPGRHEMVLFDINRYTSASLLMKTDHASLTDRLIADQQLPFGLTLVGNLTEYTLSTVAAHKPAMASAVESWEDLNVDWPHDVFSLSHVAVPFPPNDPLYGAAAPEEREMVFLGKQPLQGETGMLQIPANYLTRLRHNPFYDYMLARISSWLDTAQ